MFLNHSHHKSLTALMLGAGLVCAGSAYGIKSDNLIKSRQLPSTEIINADRIPESRRHAFKTTRCHYSPRRIAWYESWAFNVDVMDSVGGFKKEYGGPQFKRSSLQAGLSFSKYFNPYLGLEFGYQFSENRDKDVVTNDGEIVFGTVQDILDVSDNDPDVPASGDVLYSNNRYELTGPYFGIKTRTYLPVERAQFQIEFLAGFSWTRAVFLHAPYRYVRSTTGLVTDFNDRFRNKYRIYLSDYALIPRISVKVGSNITRRISMRVGLSFEGTSKIKRVGYYPVDLLHTPRIFKLKNHLSYSAGFSFVF